MGRITPRNGGAAEEQSPGRDEDGSSTRLWSVGAASVLSAGTAIGGAPDALQAADQLATYGVTIPLQSGIGTAACEVGLGALITAGLWVAAVFLAYLSIGDLVSGFANRNSQSTSGQRQSSSDFKNGGMKMVGAVLVAGAPTILSGVGFTLLDCVEAVDVFSAVIVPLV